MRTQGVAAAAVIVAAVAAGCTGTNDDPPVVSNSTGEVRLVSFDSCDAAIEDLRRAVLPQVGAYGLGDGTRAAGRELSGGAAEDAAAPAERPAAADDAAGPGSATHSTTNVHEAGVDEPDVVKTDGRRVVTVVDGTLRVIDVATRSLVASTPIGRDGSHFPTGLLLSGDHALVFSQGARAYGPAEDMPLMGDESVVTLVDLATDRPALLGSFSIDGRFVDARMVGTTARVVTSSQPRFEFVHPDSRFGEGIAAKRNRELVQRSGAEHWLPRYRVTDGPTTREGHVDCAAVSRASGSSATSMLTVSTFDLAQDTLGDGDGLTIVADGDTVYGTATSLYVTSDPSRAFFGGGGGPAIDAPAPGPSGGRTDVHKFDTTGAGTPRHVASATVPGSLLNQYSMSEFDGHLRVATTEGGSAGVSAVHVLDPALRTVGSVGGLGKGERIYAVRYVGPLGYVVTFRQTDPLYTLDLRDPRNPKVTGELKITGFSAYLHPVGDGRLLGVGQEADTQGRALGMQVSLFDVSDPTAPNRLAQYHVRNEGSVAESDPHAFLWWPETSTVVLPVFGRTGEGEAVVLRVGDADLTPVETLRAPARHGPVIRTMMIDDALWLLSHGGLAAPQHGTTVTWG